MTLTQIRDAPAMATATRHTRPATRRAATPTSDPIKSIVEDPFIVLGVHALRLKRAVRLGEGPGRWRSEAFGHQVDLVRRHLAPIRSRSTLAASFGRESLHTIGVAARPELLLAASPTAVAYTVRWLELRSGARLPSWLDWVLSAAASTDQRTADSAR